MRKLLNWLIVIVTLAVGCQEVETIPLYSVRIASLKTAGVKLVKSNPSTTDWFGTSVAVSKGSVIVGARGLERAYIFTGTGTIWKQQDYVGLSFSTGAKQFGRTIAIEGDTAVVGYNGGVAYLFQRNGISWLEKKQLFATGGPFNDGCGRSLDMDGNSIIVGAPNENGQAKEAGAAYIFVRNGTIWHQQATLRGSKSIAFSGFGIDVAIDGDTAVASSQYLNKTKERYVYIFVRTGTSWSQQKVLSWSSQGATGFWGGTVDVRNETVAIGDPRYGRNGSVFIYTRSGTSWSIQQKITSSIARKADTLGGNVSLGQDALAVPFYTTIGYVSGVVFHRRGTTWTETQRLTTEERGTVLSISFDDDTVALANQGSAYVYKVYKPDGGPDAGPDFGPDTSQPDLSAKDMAADADLGEALPVEGCSCTMNMAQLASPLMPLLGLTILSLLRRARKRRPFKP